MATISDDSSPWSGSRCGAGKCYINAASASAACGAAVFWGGGWVGGRPSTSSNSMTVTTLLSDRSWNSGCILLHVGSGGDWVCQPQWGSLVAAPPVLHLHFFPSVSLHVAWSLCCCGSIRLPYASSSYSCRQRRCVCHAASHERDLPPGPCAGAGPAGCVVVLPTCAHAHWSRVVMQCHSPVAVSGGGCWQHMTAHAYVCASAYVGPSPGM